MPYRTTSKWVSPKRVLRFKGVTIYHTYEDDDIGNGPYNNYFTVTSDSDAPEKQFDVRQLSTYTEPPHPMYKTGPEWEALTPRGKQLVDDAWNRYHADKVELKHNIAVMKAAIKKGELNQNGRVKN